MPDVLDAEELKRLDLMEGPIGIELTPEPWQFFRAGVSTTYNVLSGAFSSV
jgi:hypothetical protein